MVELLNSTLQTSLPDGTMTVLTAFRGEADSRNLLSMLDSKRGQLFVFGDDYIPDIRVAVDYANHRVHLEAEICTFPTVVVDEVDRLISNMW